MGRPPIFTRAQYAERARARRIRSDKAATKARADLVRAHEAEYRVLYDRYLAEIEEAEGPLPYEEIARVALKNRLNEAEAKIEAVAEREQRVKEQRAAAEQEREALRKKMGLD